MISQKESSINIDPQTYVKVMDMQRQYQVARENEWYARQEQASVADIPYRSMNELVSHVRYLESEIRYLKSVIDEKSLLLDTSIEEIYGDKI
jgi:hypothetical protein